jgi:hypothetical protein
MGLLSMSPSLLQMSRLLSSCCALPLKWSGLRPRILQFLTGTLKAFLWKFNEKACKYWYDFLKLVNLHNLEF